MKTNEIKRIFKKLKTLQEDNMKDKALKHSYFISYHYACAASRTSGFGSTEVYTPKPLKLNDLSTTKEMLQTRIKEGSGAISPHVVILNIIKMKG